jgi:hypothetical protein
MLFVYGLKIGEKIAEIDLEGMQPDLLKVTKSMGMILVLLNLEIRVFTTNGTFFQKICLGSELKHWNCFSDYNGLDFVIVKRSGTNLFVLDVTKREGIVELKGGIGNIVACGYLKRKRCVVGLSDGGLIFCFPFSVW